MAHPSGFTASEMTLHITATNAPAEGANPGDALRAYSVTAAAFPDFAFNTEERNAGGYLDEVDTLLPVQELTFSVNIFDEKIFRAQMRPFQHLGAITANTNKAVAGNTDDSPAFEFYTTLKEQASAQRQALRLNYQGRVRSVTQSGYTPDGLQTFDVVVRPCYYYKRDVSQKVNGDAGTDLSWNTLQEIDLIKGEYIVNGLDLWAARKKTLGL